MTVWSSAEVLVGQMAEEQIRANKLSGSPSSCGKRLLLEAGSQIPEKGVMIMSVEKQNVPEVEFLNPVIHHWW